eukprot:TRINITY_DN930_c0_g1_i2.p1 TRINITY_DN930_c0_g1~~TRINITY_DN930_c0_g1_i2.p1  ORF type:complete len:540 (-),score=152.25 TRINITY_DN930_c0_g1_i2:189-1748(-)
MCIRDRYMGLLMLNGNFISEHRTTTQERFAPVVRERVEEREVSYVVRVPEVTREIIVPVERDRERLEALKVSIAQLEATLRQRDQDILTLRTRGTAAEARMNSIFQENQALYNLVSSRQLEIDSLMARSSALELRNSQVIEGPPIIKENVVTRPVFVEQVREEIVERPRVIERQVEVPVEREVVIQRERLVEREVPIEQIVHRDVVVERPVIVEQVVERPYEVPRVVERLVERSVVIERPVEREVHVPVDVPRFVEVTREVEVPRLVESVVHVPVTRDVVTEREVVVHVDRPVEVPRLVESIVERPVIVERPRVVEQVVERVVEVPRPVEQVVQRPVEREVMVESVVQRFVDRPVIVTRDIPVPNIVEREVHTPRLVDRPVFVDRVVERPIVVERVLSQGGTPKGANPNALGFSLATSVSTTYTNNQVYPPGVLAPPQTLLPPLLPPGQVNFVPMTTAAPPLPPFEERRPQVSAPKLLKRSNDNIRLQFGNSDPANRDDFAPLNMNLANSIELPKNWKA